MRLRSWKQYCAEQNIVDFRSRSIKGPDFSTQLELEVVAENRAAIALYESVGFVEYGRNPKGFRSRFIGWQEVVLMRLDMDNGE